MRVLILLLLATLSCCTATSNLTQGALSPAYLPERTQIGVHLDQMIATSTVEAKSIITLVKALNEEHPGAGTGCLIGAILPRVALQYMVEGDITVRPVPSPGVPGP
jgi:hypothetical protein